MSLPVVALHHVVAGARPHEVVARACVHEVVPAELPDHVGRGVPRRRSSPGVPSTVAASAPDTTASAPAAASTVTLLFIATPSIGYRPFTSLG